MRRSMLTAGGAPVDTGMVEWQNPPAYGGSNVKFWVSTYRPLPSAATLTKVSFSDFQNYAYGYDWSASVGYFSGSTFIVRAASETWTAPSSYAGHTRVLSTPIAGLAGDVVGVWCSGSIPLNYRTGGIYAGGQGYSTRFNVNGAPYAGQQIAMGSPILYDGAYAIYASA